jgi:hypothetical protein
MVIFFSNHLSISDDRTNLNFLQAVSNSSYPRLFHPRLFIPKTIPKIIPLYRIEGLIQALPIGQNDVVVLT